MLTRLKKFLFPKKQLLDLSRAQIALLSQFKRADTLRARGWREGWEIALKANPDQLLQEFVQTGLIVHAPAEDHIDHLNMTQLKAILKNLGLSISGKKSVLVQRILLSGYDVFKDFDDKLWKCSEAGLVFVAPYLAAEEQREKDAIEGARKALGCGDLAVAAKIAAKYKAGGVFGTVSLSGEIVANGMVISAKEPWTAEVWAKQMLDGLETFQATKMQRPASFTDVPEDIFNEAADACSWSCLHLGKGERRQGAERVALELWGWRTSKENLERYKKSEVDGIISGVEILCGDECPVGSAHKGKIYPTSQVPELPLVGCKREPCCACTYTAHVKGF